MRLILPTLLAAFCLALLAGCGSTKPSRFYLLTPVETQNATAVAMQAPTLGIGPVAFPAYLDRTEIVLRSGGNEIRYAGSHRWAEPLKKAFSQILSENLSIMLPTDRTLVYPWPRSTRLDYQVVINVTRFDADADGTVILTADWDIIRSSDSTVIKRNKVSYNETAGSTDYAAVVAAQSRAVEQLSRDISAVISSDGSHADQPR